MSFSAGSVTKRLFSERRNAERTAATSVSEHFAAGFALAATIARDSAAQAARAGLAESVADDLTRTARELASLSKAERRARIGSLAHTPRPSLPDEARAPERAFALLCRTERRARAPHWLQGAPLPRPGYVPDAGLVALLARIFAKSAREAR